MADVVVIGAGPAGCSAAIHLADAGKRVVLVDKARFPRDKCCGDGLTTGALRELARLGFAPSDVPSWSEVGSAWVRSPRGREVEFPFPDHRGLYGAVAPRGELDVALVRLATTRNVTVIEGAAVSDLSNRGSGITVTIAGHGDVLASYAVCADGMWSPTRKMLGIQTKGYLGEWHAARQYASNVTGTAAERLWVWFEPDLLPGYAWSFPLPGGRANVGFGIARDTGIRTQEMKALWTNLVGRPHVRTALGPAAVLDDRHLAWPIPARIDDISLGTGRALFVGDAAAACDPMTGEGIGQALLTGRFAAQAIIGARSEEPTTALVNYQKLVATNLVPDHRFASRLTRILASQRGANGSIALAATNDWTRRNFGRWLFEDEPRAALFTPRRWHRGFLRRDGAELRARASS